MTGEKAALAELGRDQEWLVTKAQEITAKVRPKDAPIDWVAISSPGRLNGVPDNKPPKKRRSDLGKPRKPPTLTRSITTAQAQELCSLINEEFLARESFAAAEDHLRNAMRKREAFVAALTAK